MSSNKKKLKAVFLVAEDVLQEQPENYEIIANSSDIELINGKTLDSEMSQLRKELSGRIDSNTLILIDAHGNIDKYGQFARPGEHIIQLNNAGLVYSSAELISKIEKTTKMPLKFFLQSCFSSNGLRYAISALKSESIIVTSAKENHSSVASFTALELNHWKESLIKEENIFNPYADFLNLFSIKAMQYAKFVTKKAVFEIKPDYRILLSPDLARNFLIKEAERFIKFASTKTWKGKKITLSSQEFSDDVVKTFSGNLFHHLCGIGEEEFIDFLNKNLDNNAFFKSYINHTPVFDQPINIASIGGHTKIIEILIKNGVNVNNQGYLGSSPFSSAIEAGHNELAGQLIEHGADVNLKRINGDTALIIASDLGNLEAVQLIIKNNGSVNDCDNKGVTALHRAVLKGNTEVVEFLLNHNASTEIAHESGVTPLITALQNKNINLDIINLLLDHGAEVNITDNEGLSPLILAIKSNNFELVEKIVIKGTCLNYVDSKDLTPIGYALVLGNDNIIRFLIKKGADTKIHSNLFSGDLLDIFPVFEGLKEFILNEREISVEAANLLCQKSYEISFSGEVIDNE